MAECPTCERTDFESDRGMRRHHAIAHGESLSYVTHECKECGEDFEIPMAWDEKDDRRFCSQECHTEYQKQGETVPCEACGEGVYVAPREDSPHFCGPDCAYGNRNHDELIRVAVECDQCGSEYEARPDHEERTRFCGMACKGRWMSENWQGEDNPSWTGNAAYSTVYDTPRWDRVRREVYERDGHVCTVCEDPASGPLHAHHEVPLSEGGAPFDLKNLRTVCLGCHNAIHA